MNDPAFYHFSLSLCECQDLNPPLITLRYNQTNGPAYYTLSAMVCVKIFVGLAQFVHSKILYSFSTCDLMVSWCVSYSDMKVFIILWMAQLFTNFLCPSASGRIWTLGLVILRYNQTHGPAYYTLSAMLCVKNIYRIGPVPTFCGGNHRQMWVWFAFPMQSSSNLSLSHPQKPHLSLSLAHLIIIQDGSDLKLGFCLQIFFWLWK